MNKNGDAWNKTSINDHRRHIESILSIPSIRPYIHATIQSIFGRISI